MDDRKIESWMFRAPGESLALVVTFTIVFLIAFVFFNLDIYLFIGGILISLIYVRLTQAQYMGNAIRVYSQQFPELYEIFKKHAISLNIQKAGLYIKQDPNLNAFTLGIGTCTVVLTSALVEQLNEEELSFVLAHELGHFKAGHTKISTIFQPIGSGNLITSLIFGFWNRASEYTADNCGLAVTRKIDPAMTAFMKLAIGKELFRKLDIDAYLQQIKKSNVRSVKLGEMLGSHPVTANRIINALSYWRNNFKHVRES